MNFLLRNIFFIFVLLFLAIDGFFIVDNSFIKIEYIEYIFLVTIIEIVLLSIIAYTTSIKPIRILKKEIALFLTGAQK